MLYSSRISLILCSSNQRTQRENEMEALTTINNTGLNSYSIKSGNGDLLATSTKNQDGTYNIYIYGGIAHGKIALAQDWQDLNDKSVEILKIRNAA